jgi:hypothetical protein
MQRRLLAGVGCLIAIASVAWIAAAAGSEGDPAPVERVMGSSTVRTTETTDTTLPLVPVTSGVPLPPTSAVPSSVPLPSADQVAAAVPTTTAPESAGPKPPPALTADGAVLAKPATPSTRPVDKARGCHSAVDAGWRIVECGALRRDDGVLLWLTESRGKGLRALVLREQTAGNWAPMLVAFDDDGSRWSKIGVRGEDVSGDGKSDLVFGFHLRAPAGSLAVDVVDGPGVVTLHRLAAGGSVRVAKGELHEWAALADGSYEHATIKVLAGAWRVAATERVGKEAVPASMV